MTLSLLWLFAVDTAQAQTNDSTYNEPTTVSLTDKGLQFKKGDAFLLNMRFRAQFRAGYYSRTDDSDNQGVEAIVRRLRLRFEGYLVSPKLEYKLQLAFANKDMDLESGSPQIIRDAVFYYKPTTKWSFGLGQTKLPGNRERLNSSGELQMPDRSIANGKFTIDRDFGIFIDRDFEIGKQLLQLQGAISTGEGRGQLVSDKGLAYTGRLEYMPFGAFANGGDYFEGDLLFEQTPKLSLGFTWSKNFRAKRTGGQLDEYIYSTYDKEEELFMDMRTTMSDAVLKYNGWAVLAEYYDRKVDNFSVTDFAARPDDARIFRKVPAGKAFNIQASKMISKKDEVVMRYTEVRPHKSVSNYQYHLRTKAVGYSHYFNKHKFKIQGYVGLDDRMGKSTELNDPFENRLNAMLQIEMGI
ncbi:MAG: porin [Niabella sp.]